MPRESYHASELVCSETSLQRHLWHFYVITPIDLSLVRFASFYDSCNISSQPLVAQPCLGSAYSISDLSKMPDGNFRDNVLTISIVIPATSVAELLWELCHEFPWMEQGNTSVRVISVTNKQTNFLKVYIFQYCKYRFCRLKGFKVTSFQSRRSQEKVCLLAPATLEPAGLDSNLPAVESLSKLDGWELCSPLTYRPQIFSIKRSKPL